MHTLNIRVDWDPHSYWEPKKYKYGKTRHGRPLALNGLPGNTYHAPPTPCFVREYNYAKRHCMLELQAGE